MHLLPFRALYPSLDQIPAPESFFLNLKEEFPEYYQGGIFRECPREAFYIYQIATPYRQYFGLVACSDILDYRDGAIRPHEHTLAEKMGKQMELLRRRLAEVKPVLLTYPEVPAISRWTRRFTDRHAPFLTIRFAAEDQWHHLWMVDDPQRIAEIQKLFARSVPFSYIADGHHRTSSLAELFQTTTDQRFRRLLCAFFPSTDLDILEFNRVVTPAPDLTQPRLMTALSRLFDIEALAIPHKPTQKHELLMLTAREWFRLQWKPAVLAEHSGEEVILDTMMLNEKVIRGVFGIREVRNDQRVEYVEGPKDMEALIAMIAQDERKIGFALHPIALPELMALADQGGVLPPKSTWFEPRMKNGVLVLKY